MNIRVLTILSIILLLTISSEAANQNKKRAVKVVGHEQEVSGSENKIALVIGNGAYKDSPLRNPVNDARAMSEVLRSLGFEVMSGTNLDGKQMKKIIHEFGDRLLNRKGVGLFYYAGHGIQLNGINYLIPVDSTIDNERDVDIETIRADMVLAKMDNARNRLNIVILDACRNNPFGRSFRSEAAKGLASMDAPAGTIIAYATAPGSVASDGTGRNGLYTEELIRSMRQPGLKIEDVFKRVRSNVRQETNNKQTPWESSSLEGDFYFIRPAGKIQSEGEQVDAQPVSVAPEKRQTEAQSKQSAVKGSSSSGTGDSLDNMLASMEQRKNRQEAELEGIKTDVSKYLKIKSSGDADSELKREAWQALVSRHPKEAEGLSEGDADGIIKNYYAKRGLKMPNYKDPATGMEFVYVKGGCYQMGDTFGDGDKDEKPVHEVCVDDFNIGKYEVTVGQFRKFVTSTGYTTEAERGDGCYVWTGSEWKKERQYKWKNLNISQGEDEPVVCVSWNDTQAMIEWMNRQGKGRYRLPTEAEWEYACRSGGKSERYCGGNDIDSVAWYKNNSGNRTHPVGQKSPNGLGLYDMSGNVWEWVSDWYGEGYYSNSERRNPKGSSSGEYKSLRGGSWSDPPTNVRAAQRDGDTSTIRKALPSGFVSSFLPKSSYILDSRILYSSFRGNPRSGSKIFLEKVKRNKRITVICKDV